MIPNMQTSLVAQHQMNDDDEGQVLSDGSARFI